MGLVPFDISVAPANNRVIVDGQDISSQITRVTIDAQGHDVPKVFVEMIGEGRIVGEGIITQVLDLDPREAVLEFLNNIDAGALEGAALERCGGFGSDETTGQAFINALIEMASGD